MRSFAHLWQQDELSDVDIVLTGPLDSTSPTETCTSKLATFPGHSVLLSDSPFFKAQILRWQNKRQRDEDIAAAADQAAAVGTQKRGSTKKRGNTARGGKQKQQEAQQQKQTAEAASGSAAAGSSSNRRPQLVLTLEHADQQPAALVVLEALYATKPLPELLSGLQQEQQLQAIVLADMWQVPDVATAAASLLAEAANGQLSEAATQRLLSMQAWPTCLHVVAKRVLLLLLGDLEAVLSDEALLQQLLGLPLHAMALLLSCNELKVASEDTVLYTVRRYAGTNGRLPALQQLASLIRCPQLSLYCLAALATSKDPLMAAVALRLPQLSALLLARIIKEDCLTTTDLEQLVDAPASWMLPRRVSLPVSSVQLTWVLPVDDPRKQVQRSIADNEITNISFVEMTARLSGFCFSLDLECVPKDGGCLVGMYVQVHDFMNCDVCVSFKYRMHIPGSRLDMVEHTPATTTRMGWGWNDFFGFVAKAEGWDEEAWKAKGLPTSDTLPITLTVFGMSKHHTAPPSEGDAFI